MRKKTQAGKIVYQMYLEMYSIIMIAIYIKFYWYLIYSAMCDLFWKSTEQKSSLSDYQTYKKKSKISKFSSQNKTFSYIISVITLANFFKEHFWGWQSMPWHVDPTLFPVDNIHIPE